MCCFMADYTGQSCFHCQKPFQPEDDVVVCPECGTPYHRACWQETDHCTNFQLHETGGSWKPVQQEEESAKEETRRCPRCGTDNPVQQAFCGHCGMILNASQAADPSQRGAQWQNTSAEDICCGLDPNEQYEGERLEDVANFVRTNTMYYIPIFKKFRETGSKLSMNLISALLPHFYFASRKMWGMTFLVIIAFLLLNLPSELYSFVTDGDLVISNLRSLQESMGSLYSGIFDTMIQQTEAFCNALQPHETLIHWLYMICMYLNFAVRVLLFAFSNYFYYRFVLRKVRKIRAEDLPVSMQKDRLRMAGGTNYWFVLLSILARYSVSVLFSMLFILGINLAF